MVDQGLEGKSFLRILRDLCHQILGLKQKPLYCTYYVRVQEKGQTASHGSLNAVVESTEGHSEGSASRPSSLELRYPQEGDGRGQCHAELKLIGVTIPSHLPGRKKAALYRARDFGA